CRSSIVFSTPAASPSISITGSGGRAPYPGRSIGAGRRPAAAKLFSCAAQISADPPMPWRNTQNWSGDQFIGHLGRAVALDHGLCLGIVGALQHRAGAEPLAAHDDCHGSGGTALFGMDRMRRHQIDRALRAGGYRGESHVGVAGSAAVVDALVAFEALRSVENTVEHPGIGVVVDAAGTARRAHDGVDDEVMVGIDVE